MSEIIIRLGNDIMINNPITNELANLMRDRLEKIIEIEKHEDANLRIGLHTTLHNEYWLKIVEILERHGIY